MSSHHTLPLVLIPGHMGTALDWRFQIDALAKGRQVIVPDQHYRLNSIKNMARDIAPRLPASFDLVGWSMGGYIIFELSPLIRGRVRKTVLIHTSARPETEAARTRRQDLLRSIGTEGMAAALTRDLANCLLHPERVAAEFKEAVIAGKLQLGKQTLLNQIEALGARADARPLLGQMNSQTLVVAGRQDTIAPVAHSVEIAAMLPRAELHVFEDAGHCSPWEKAHELNALLREFVA